MANAALARSQTYVQADERIGEEWRINPRFPNYEISSHGRVRRLTTVTNGKAGRILKAALHYGGYRHHGLSVNGVIKTVRLNRLVCETFHGPAPSPDHVAAHNDSNVENYRADNLRWATHAENDADKDLAGRRKIGSSCRNAKLTEADIPVIRASTEIARLVAARYGINLNSVYKIKKRQTWKHVP